MLKTLVSLHVFEAITFIIGTIVLIVEYVKVFNLDDKKSHTSASCTRKWWDGLSTYPPIWRVFSIIFIIIY